MRWNRCDGNAAFDNRAVLLECHGHLHCSTEVGTSAAVKVVSGRQNYDMLFALAACTEAILGHCGVIDAQWGQKVDTAATLSIIDLLNGANIGIARKRTHASAGGCAELEKSGESRKLRHEMHEDFFALDEQRLDLLMHRVPHRAP
jgi:hypothetical protein